MSTWYVILPGTTVAVSRDGGDFRTRMLRRMLQFREPTETTDESMTFVKGPWRVLVKRANVVISRYNGLVGHNQFGA